jgi:hypothetical protein
MSELHFPQPQTGDAPLLSPNGAPMAHAEDDFDRAFGESFLDTLNLSTWRPGEDLLTAYARIEQEVADAVARENAHIRDVRKVIFPQLVDAPQAPPGAGVYSADPDVLESVHTGLLFSGQVEASNGNSVVHQTLPLSVTQIGVSLVSYQGRMGTWANRLFRRDLRERMENSVEELFAVLSRRESGSSNEPLSDLARRGVMHYAERAILKEESTALWRMGHGHVLPFELLSGFWASHVNTLRHSLELFEWYADYGRFVFVPTTVRRKHLLTLGNALRPGEYALVECADLELQKLIHSGHYRTESGVLQALEEFCAQIAPRFVVGVFRVFASAPPCVFYAHADHAHMAAHIAIADSMLQQVHGFPMLIRLADQVCRNNLGMDSLLPTVQTAYAAAGEPQHAAHPH